jgi:hypothetical protein
MNSCELRCTRPSTGAAGVCPNDFGLTLQTTIPLRLQAHLPPLPEVWAITNQEAHYRIIDVYFFVYISDIPFSVSMKV